MKSLDRAYFEKLYAKDDDPWSFGTSDYEREKYDRTLATLDHHYARGLEIGCSIGVLTRRLASYVERLLAVDISERAVERARENCHDVPNVTLAQRDVLTAYPAGPFDLIVVSEVAYYWSDRDFATMRKRIVDSLALDGDVLLVHFLPNVHDYARDGDAVHETFLAEPRLRRLRASRAESYRIDLLRVTR